MTAIWLILPAAAVLSFGLTWWIRNYAVKRRLLDVPNERSSHDVATPRGGGVSIALTFLFCLTLLCIWGFLPSRTLIALGGSAGFVALIGFMDDHHDIHPGLRLLTHFAAAIWALYLLAGIPAVPLLGYEIPAGFPAKAIAAIFLVWMLNLYNFMDGIDGIAGVEAVTVCPGAALIHLTVVPDSGFWIVPAILAASVVGFLFWNFPPARIFMGDVGSGFVGFSLGVMAIQAMSHEPQIIFSWLIMLGVFIVDATTTLVRRLWQREKIYMPHRSHAYQHASRQLNSHRIVTNAIGAINVVWLFPWALAVANGKIDGMIGLLSAYAPLFWLVIHFRAGIPDD